MTTKANGAAPKKGPPAKLKTDSQRALTRAFDGQRVSALTADIFLRSQGPKVVDVTLANMGAVVLMRRLDLYDLARRGASYFPFRAAIFGMISEGGVTDKQASAAEIDGTLDLAARVALDSIMIPPPSFVEAVEADVAAHEPLIDAWETEVEAARAAKDYVRAQALALAMPPRPREHVDAVLAQIDPGALRPLFVELGDEPGPGQMVLRYAIPDDDADLPAEGAAGEGGGMHPADMIAILRAAHRHGPGAMGRRFRGQ